MVCMDKRLYTLQINQITGMVILAQQKTKAKSGTPEELEQFYKEVLTHNLLFGWWGIFAIFWNIIALVRNAKAMARLHVLIAEDTK